MATAQPTPFGKPMLKHWLFDPSYKNLNHGSFGAHPAPIRDAQRAFLDIADLRPDPYIRKQHTKLLEKARQGVATIINAPKDECVFVKNATTGVATVLYNLNFQPNEALIYFEPVYGAVEKGIVSMQEHSPFKARKVNFHYPITQDELERRFRETVTRARAEGLTVRAAVFDAIVSNPGVRFPFEKFVAICREEGILSVIDGAHGIGQIPLDMSVLQPDFLTSNCHKWLYTPRSAAVLYIPKRNQHFMRSTLPTSWGFIPAAGSAETIASVLQDPTAAKTQTPFEELFEFVATSDDSAYICVEAALKFRKEVCGGEEAIMAYCQKVANEGADAIASILGTEVLQEPGLKAGEKSMMRACALTTVRLPIAVADQPADSMASGALVTLSSSEASRAFAFIQRTLIEKYDTFVPTFQHGPWLWTRLSGQIYVEKSDFEWLGGILRELCEQIARNEY
ncbi:hypothetical protein N7509_010152 [Penicillium cosmopolitanum]|uniref:Aminotransferase class V domain-containing protein n=1 Tax=Penicillium cosmopolitanum TaxID=1131564 RepID=A0A9W9VQS2_9EURO|nr:uncharacterized protein N7509_010152 [Penicillium cosmopolitanum]KAJ5387611.1 hypothetical protein N7509_010152 [Penicillium cosmopolitanum]